MIKKILFIAIISIQFTLFGALNSSHWKAIAKDIARDGDALSLTEFEAAKEAFLHIKDEAAALEAAQVIQNKWKSTFGIVASVGSKQKESTLMSLIRYPLMTRKQAFEATKKLLNHKKVAQFLEEQDIDLSIRPKVGRKYL